ncbi:hypothetical protein RV00_GL001157 [Enterococcus devriesei]|uniref:HTH marR-type domain-containing protein n=1 Tax=Enterococcus devriesei TaxID=319970 RepID=A0A1L8SXT0_9ENTE|nr:hypothetical protein RV00_GL001157 [Enterococcus devriesei]
MEPVKTNEDNLSENIYQANLVQQEFIETRLKKIGLTSHQARALNYISRYPGVIQKKIANYLGKQDATITNILKTLEKKDYIYREIPKNNERQKNLFLTEKGEESIKQIRLIFQDLEAQLTQELEAEEQLLLKKLLKKIQ